MRDAGCGMRDAGYEIEVSIPVHPSEACADICHAQCAGANRMTNDEGMTNDSSSQFSCSRSRETLGTSANAQTLTSSATTTGRLTPIWEVLNEA